MKLALMMVVFVSATRFALEASAFVAPHISRRDNRRMGSLSYWSQIVELDEEGKTCCKDSSEEVSLGSPRQWLEFCEAKDGQGGAYTVMRCDPEMPSFKLPGRFKSSELSFHLSRLQYSFSTLNPETIDATCLFDDAKKDTRVILDALVNNFSRYRQKTGSGAPDVVMLTILWTRTSRSGPNIVVRGHARGVSNDYLYNPSPIRVTLALSSNHEQLPNRYANHPESKQSSWCRQRRPLEEAFPGFDEILLVRPRESEESHILEGLTSNVFFVYPDNKLRTAQDGVLKGFARKLVLDIAEEACGLQHDPNPIRVHDAHLWQEVFTTSSIRLIVPIKEIAIPDDETRVATVFWSDPRNGVHPKWKCLYRELLRKNALLGASR